MSEIQSTPLSAAFTTTQEGLGQGNDGINASSSLWYRTMHPSALNSGITHSRL